MFHGAIVATVTPFRNGNLDKNALKKLVTFQIESGTDGIVPCGTTGESATLSFEEHERVIDIVLESADGRVPVIAGTGSNNTKEAVALTRYAKKAGVNGALVITPYYNKPTQDGLLRHFRAVAESADIPIILYNVPGRTGVNMAAQTVARLAEIPNIVGVKEASGNLNQVCDIIRMTPKKFCVLSGDDALFFPMMALGAKGVISVTSNVAPRLMAELYDTYVIGEISRARDIHYHLWPLFQALFLETNPIPAKTALAMMKKIREEFRLPLSPMADASRKALAKTLSDMKLV
ncbi:MAG TPA: 4-hydroxy-tetrahydrodipicolinate synthase [Candidatus Limnocylindria bacterium]|nr:4-hydroxy-tetrahydrodipicolinate synthase [Deltaproteobacteria bacterium]HSL98854.1 4-hydroxy-tetrahydrodipicolinate synthase [Candidatus Limnocylindria bacterium]